MEDYLGNEVNVGDNVIIIRPNYRELVLATVVKLTPKKIKVSYMRHDTLCLDEYICDRWMLVKVEPSDLAMAKLKGKV